MQWQAHIVRGSLLDNKKNILGQGKGTWKTRQKCNPSPTPHLHPALVCPPQDLKSSN